MIQVAYGGKISNASRKQLYPKPSCWVFQYVFSRQQWHRYVQSEVLKHPVYSMYPHRRCRLCRHPDCDSRPVLDHHSHSACYLRDGDPLGRYSKCCPRHLRRHSNSCPAKQSKCSFNDECTVTVCMYVNYVQSRVRTVLSQSSCISRKIRDDFDPEGQ